MGEVVGEAEVAALRTGRRGGKASFMAITPAMTTTISSIQDDPAWSTGDVSLVSSDSVRFKVCSKVLAATR